MQHGGEAKNTVGAISRAAQAAYEREEFVKGVPVHRLCTSAIPVPARVPSAKRYAPSPAPGVDFQSGTASAGWTCLRFGMSNPMYYQYHYQQGSGWVVPSGAPGPDGFEAAAVGDIDGDGVKSTFARTGKVSGGALMLSTNLYIDNEFE